jgi:hypothetical protein
MTGWPDLIGTVIADFVCERRQECPNHGFTDRPPPTVEREYPLPEH